MDGPRHQFIDSVRIASGAYRLSANKQDDRADQTG
jgi:hypothetical protein